MEIADLAGMYKSQPMLAWMVFIAVVSLIGIPPTVGFVGKVYLFGLATDAGYYTLAVVGVLTSVASAYYYLRLLVTMFFQEAPADQEAIPAPAFVNKLILGLGAVAVFLFAILPALYLFSN